MNGSEASAKTPSDRPTLRIVSGEPTPDELAALLTVLAARSSDSTGSVTGKRSLWAARSRQVRPSLGAGLGAWRASTLPR